MTQEQLADTAKMSKGFLSDVENDKRSVSAMNAVKIADALGASLDFLMRGAQGEREVAAKTVEIPPELSAAAQELGLSYADTLLLLEARETVVARRSSRSMELRPTVGEWKQLYEAIDRVYPRGDRADK